LIEKMNSGNSIKMRKLGNTDIQVSPIGLGVMEFSGGGGLLGFAFPVIQQGEKNAIIKSALEGGINWFDTAEMYGSGVSEQSLATGLREAGASDDEVVIANKWFPLFRTAANIRKTIDERLAYLDGYSIDNYMVHQPWSFSSPEAEMQAMADLVEAGKIHSVGVSNFSADRMRRAHESLQKQGLPLAVNQVHYSLLNRDIETNGVLDAARELGITIISYTPLESGLLTGKYHMDPDLLDQKPFFRRWNLRRKLESTRTLIDALKESAEGYDATIAQVALNWLIHFQGELVVTIPGATDVKQVRENAGAMAFKLSGEELDRLDKLSLNI